MANIRVDSPITIFDGQAVTFKSPTDCSQITGLKVYYPDNGTTLTKVFQFADAHGNNVGDLDLFASDVVVKVILDTDNNMAFVQNADTNAYLEGRFDGKADVSHSHTASEVGAAPASHNHSASNITSGTLAVARGGTGVTALTGSNSLLGKLFPSSATPTYIPVMGSGYANPGYTTPTALKTAMGAASTTTYTATVTATWTASGDYFYQDITVSGILATDNPIVDINPGSSASHADVALYSESMCKVFRVVTAADKIRVWVTEKPTIAFPIQLKVVR